jgi:hypothetical protein
MKKNELSSPLYFKMFVRVKPEELVVDTKYKITVFPFEVEWDRYYGIYKKNRIYPSITYLWFDHPYDLFKWKKCCVNTVVLDTKNYYYYAFISDQPQWKMERRAVNLILRRLIGDNYFEW